MADEKAAFCSKILADLGARVVRVENPREDSSRRMGPFWHDSFHREKSLFFWYHNAAKSGISLDVEQRADRESLLKEIEHCDVVVETSAPGYLDALGLGFNALTELNPGLVMVSVTGFGQSGPRKGFKSCDLVASALGGQMYVSGSPSMEPIKAYGEQSYSTASLYAAVGALLGLRKRARTGKGEHIDISLQEAVASTLEDVMVRYFHERVVPKRRGNRHWNDFFCLLPCKDGFIHLSPLLGWETLVELLDRAGTAKDLKDQPWREEGYRTLNVDHVIETLEEWSQGSTVDELFELGQRMRFPWAPVHSPEAILRSPQLKARGFFVDSADPEAGPPVPFPGSPYKFSLGHARPTGRNSLNDEPDIKVCGGAPGSEQGAGRKGLRGAGCSQSEGENILAGVRVMDFSRVLAGPFATRILADFGAEVIKVQSKKTATGSDDNNGSYFSAWNRNKRSITLDMSRPEARDIALKLASKSNVVVENFSPRVMFNWGLNYEKLTEARKDLIMVSMSGMGQTGPWKDFVAFGPTLQSLGGLTYLTSYDKDAPIGLGHAYADAVAGLYCAVAVLAALEQRDRSGLGQHIDLSEYEAVCTLIGPALLDAAANQREIRPQGNRSPDIPAAPYGCYRCAGEDRWCAIAVFDEVEWQALCRVSGHPEWGQDPRFSTLAMRKERPKELDPLIQEWTSRNTAERVMQLLQEAGVQAGVVQSAQDLANDPHLQARGFFVHLDHPVLGKTVSDRTPIQMGRDALMGWKRAPLLGEDNEYVYLELLGLSEVEFRSYVEKGIIG
jgi:crotonobetainyl-CoA:carnitine CoA-transferase CaiB-like acyl-CoA transferase